VTRHEQAAAFMAATHGQLTGEAGVCLSTLGPGALNLTTGAAYAQLGAMPMVMITGQKGILTRKQARFQVVDVVATMTPLTKMAHQIVSPVTIPSIVREAFRVAQQERPGPVHLELPEDIAEEKAPEIPPVPPHPITLPVAHPAALDRAAGLILEAKRPLVMLGAAAKVRFQPCDIRAYVEASLCPVQQKAQGWARPPEVRSTIFIGPRTGSRDDVARAQQTCQMLKDSLRSSRSA
jgi:acetolactate synthase-1/2/3 large subunit